MMSRKVLLIAICNFLLLSQFISVTSFVSAVPINRNPLKTTSFVDKYVVASNVPLQESLSETVSSHEEVSGGQASLSSSTFNLAKSVIGAGVLSLPSGIAFFSDQPSALLPAAVICGIFGLVAAYSFSSIGKVCRDTKSKSFQEAWEKTVDKKSAFLISGSITSMCFLASLAYSIIIGDSFTSLFQVIFHSLLFFLTEFSNVPLYRPSISRALSRSDQM